MSATVLRRQSGAAAGPDGRANGKAASMLDFAPFLDPSFDPQDYANRIIEGQASAGPSSSPADSASRGGADRTLTNPLGPDTWLGGGARGYAGGTGAVEGDVSVALSKLNLAIDEVGRMIKEEVTTHAPAFLTRAASIADLDSGLSHVRDGVSELESGIEKLRSKVHTPYTTLVTLQAQLSRLRPASELLRRAGRFVLLARRLEGQMTSIVGGSAEGAARGTGKLKAVAEMEEDEADEAEGEARGRGLARAALSLAEIDALLASTSPSSALPANDEDRDDKDEESMDDVPTLTALDFIRDYLPAIDDARQTVTDMMEDMVVRGLRDLSPTLLSASLQTAYNLGSLPDLVRDLLADLTDVIRERIRAAFDMASLGRELGLKEPSIQQSAAYTSYKSRRAEPTQQTAPQWSAALWRRLETLVVDEMGAVCSKVYTLERVLKFKGDSATGVNFLEQALSVLGDKPSFIFWTTFGQSFETQSRDAARSSPFVQQTLSIGYPRLLRLFHEFFAKVSVYTDTVYSQTQQSPETVVVLRSITNFESAYLIKSTTRMNETIGTAFSGGTRQPPGAAAGANIARVLDNELDGARFDPLLVKAVVRAIGKAVESVVGRVDGMRASDASAYNLQSHGASPAQVLNAELASAMYHLAAGLSRIQQECPAGVTAQIAQLYETVQASFTAHLVKPMLDAIKREISATLTRMHRADFSKAQGAASGVMGSGTSVYMNDLSERFWFIREQLFVRYAVGDLKRAWTLDLAKSVLRTFVLHASIIRPLSESGKLKLTSDMTELEFTLSQFLVDAGHGSTGNEPLALADCGDEYRALRSFRPLLFRETSKLADEDLSLEKSGLSPLIVLHHIFVRSPLPLPHELHGWQRAEYVRWIEAHDLEAALGLVRGVVDEWKARDEEAPQAQQFVQLIKTRLDKTL